LQQIFDAYGQPCFQGEWLTCVGMGWMRSLSLAYTMKQFQLRDWLTFCQRYGSGFIEAVTNAQKGDAAWEEAREVLHRMANDGVVIHSEGVKLNFLNTVQKNAQAFEGLVDRVDRLYAKCYRGVDLATSSRVGEARNATGASVQKEEYGIFLVRDAAWATECLNERVDRPIIRYLFSEEPRAWVAITPPLDDTAEEDLKSAQTLVPMGLRISLAEAYRRFRWKAPAAGEPCLSVPGTAAAPSTKPNESEVTVLAEHPAKVPVPIGAGAHFAGIQTADEDLP
jgi:phage gp29-like protein